MSVIRVGSSSSYAEGWEHVFGGGRRAGTTRGKAATKTGRKPAAKAGGAKAARKSVKKPAAKAKAGRSGKR